MEYFSEHLRCISTFET